MTVPPHDAATVEVDRPGPGHPGRVIAAVVGVVVLALVGVLATRDPAHTRVASSPLVGRVAPPIDGPTLHGEPFRLSTMKGRWVLVNYFATWCVPCQREHPELVEFDRRHARTGDAGVVSVVFDDDPEEVARYFDRNGGDWPVVPDDGRVALSYGVAGIPESYLVDPDGFVVAKITGGVSADGLDALLRDAQAARDGEGGSR